jgi:hypothetical protein
MLRMTFTRDNSDDPAPQSPPADVCLLLRAHAEARWLGHEVVPAIRELERELEHGAGTGAGVAYLEALAIEARHHAAETDTVRRELDDLSPAGDHGVLGNARRYYAAVRRLRATVDARVQQLLAAAADASLTDDPSAPGNASAQIT